MNASIFKSVVLFGAALALAGCSGAKSFIGLEKQVPDEFEVVTRAPLSIPPDYGLRPPAPGEKRPQEKDTRTTAQEVLLGGGPNVRTRSLDPSTPLGGKSPGEAAILARAGALNADSSIRRTVDEESSALFETDQSMLDRLFWWYEKPKPGVIVDPEKEAKRIREARALGTPVNKGEVPVIKRREKGLLEGIF